MSKSLSITSDFALRDVMSDIGLRFAESPLHRIGFEITEADVDTLAKTYRDRIFRARRKAAPGQFHWFTLLLRFDEDVFLLALGNGCEWAEIYVHRGEGDNLTRRDRDQASNLATTDGTLLLHAAARR